MREYVLADIYVIDKNNRPISQANISIEAINPDVSDPIINRDFKPPSQSITTSNGHTPLPGQDASRTVALLRHRKSLTLDRVSYSYTIAAEKDGYTGYAYNVVPNETWYRVNPDTYQNTIVITIPFDSKLQAAAKGPFAYPVPYVKGKNTTLTFTNLMIPSKLEIYTLDGLLVYEKEINEFSHSFIPEGFSSGVYMYLIKNSKSTSSGKIVIVK